MKQDIAFEVLLPFLRAVQGEMLWIADETALDWISVVPASPQLSIYSNRFDVVQAANAAGYQAVFSDFDFTHLQDKHYARIVYRISKEKAVVQHVINSAAHLLAPEGEFFVAGLKQEGIKTFLDQCGDVFVESSSKKMGLAYLGCFSHTKNNAKVLGMDEYHALQWLETDSLAFFSKQGAFGWNKIDEGSVLLISVADAVYSSLPVPPRSLLDLGCGYGYLTLMTRHWPMQKRTATDNGAAALLGMRANAEHYALAVDVVASNAGDALQSGTFDLILCNPPFHRGAAVSQDLTDLFLQQTARLLQPKGVALFVVNAFIPLEQKALQWFKSIELQTSNRSYKVFKLQK